LCAKLIDLMDGSIELDNSYHSGLPGKPGAKFNIRLQCDIISMDSMEDSYHLESETVHESDDSEGTMISGAEKPIKEGEITELPEKLSVLFPEKLSVLFVDDDMVLRKLFVRSLKRVSPDWAVQEASNGETALIMIEKEEFDRSRVLGSIHDEC
jgi:hypothetical protein